MATVLSQMLKLIANVDPRMADQTVITSANIATWAASGGEKFTVTNLLEYYNDSRLTVMGVLRDKLSKDEFADAVGQNIITLPTATFASGVLAKPTGYLEKDSLFDVNMNQIGILSMAQLQKFLPDLSTSNPFVFDIGANFKCFNWSSAIIPDAATYILNYYGLTIYVSADVTGGVTVESFNDRYHTRIIQLATAIARGIGGIDKEKFAKELIG